MTADLYALKTFLQSLPAAAVVVAPSTGAMTEANEAFCHLAAIAPEDLNERQYHQILSLPEKVACFLCQGESATPATDPFFSCHAALLTTPRGDTLKVKVKHGSLPTGEVLCLLEPFSEDITLTQAHSDFVSTVSHEFRTPLTSIKGFADTLLRYGTQLPLDQQRRFVTIIKDQADRLTRLVENLLTVSKLGASRMEMSYRPVPLSRIVEKVIQTVKAKGGENPQSNRQFQVEILADLPPLWVDADKLEQILLNLIDNAVKYSFPRTIVTIRGRMEANHPEKIEILISDQGVGIAPEHLPRIFTQFARIDNPMTREVDGTGLGLYITQSLTQAMGGEISLESQPNEGTTFRLVFPVATAERQAAYRRKLYATSREEE